MAVGAHDQQINVTVGDLLLDYAVRGAGQAFDPWREASGLQLRLCCIPEKWNCLTLRRFASLGRMPRSPASKSVFSRIRASARLMAFVLLMFGMKVGAAGVCFSHELAEAGLAGTQGQALVMEVPSDTDAAGSAGKTLLSHAGTCTDCSCHHAAAVLSAVHLSLVINPQGPDGRQLGLPPSAASRKDLRPPIV